MHSGPIATAIALSLASVACTSVSADDTAALATLDQAYVDGWKQDGAALQASAIMPLLTDDAVIMPGRGTEPRRGTSAIRDFWFPEGAPPTIILDFERTPLAITIDNDLGVISGRYRMRFAYDNSTYSQEGNYMTVAERQADGKWRASQMTWNDRRVEE